MILPTSSPREPGDTLHPGLRWAFLTWARQKSAVPTQGALFSIAPCDWLTRKRVLNPIGYESAEAGAWGRL